jgi:hypothetical protein
MNSGPKNADDSCLVNQTVPTEGSLPTSVQLAQPCIDDTEKGGQVTSREDAASDGTETDDEQDVDDNTFPEGGLQAWLVVFGSFCAMVSVYGMINSAAVFESYFSTHQLAEYESFAIGWIFSMYLFIVFFAGVQVGPVFDRHGPRLLVAVGGVLVVASQLLLGLCNGMTSWIERYQPSLGAGGQWYMAC